MPLLHSLVAISSCFHIFIIILFMYCPLSFVLPYPTKQQPFTSSRIEYVLPLSGRFLSYIFHFLPYIRPIHPCPSLPSLPPFPTEPESTEPDYSLITNASCGELHHLTVGKVCEVVVGTQNTPHTTTIPSYALALRTGESCLMFILLFMRSIQKVFNLAP